VYEKELSPLGCESLNNNAINWETVRDRM